MNEELIMPKAKKKKTPEDRIPVYTWKCESSRQPLAGGTVFFYLTQLNQDGTLSCNCPGWRFVKKGQPRRCKHTDAVQGEAPTILESWKDGKTFTLVEEAPHQVAVVTAGTTSTASVKKPTTNIKYNRRVEMDF